MDREQCCVKLSVQPSRGLVDEKFTVLVQHVPPGSQLTVHALHQCEDGHTWEAFAHYIGNATGTVNGFITQVPLARELVERWYMAPGVRRVPITEGGLTATLFLPSGV
eukprot:superscaffoldBa00004649_g19233